MIVNCSNCRDDYNTTTGHHHECPPCQREECSQVRSQLTAALARAVELENQQEELRGHIDCGGLCDDPCKRITSNDIFDRRCDKHVLTAVIARAEQAERERDTASAVTFRWQAKYHELDQELNHVIANRDTLRLAYKKAREALTNALERIAMVLTVASDERYSLLKEWQAKACKWEAEGDMYGWNFHQGMAAGANWCDLIYQRIGREIRTILKEDAALPSSPATLELEAKAVRRVVEAATSFTRECNKPIYDGKLRRIVEDELFASVTALTAAQETREQR